MKCLVLGYIWVSANEMTLGEPLGSSRMELVARETNPVIRGLELFAPCPSNLQEGERHWILS